MGNVEIKNVDKMKKQEIENVDKMEKFLLLKMWIKC